MSGSGGYFAMEYFDDIMIQSTQNIIYTDLTNTLQVTMNYKYMNQKLGFIYDNSGNLIHNSFDGKFFTDLSNDSISIDADEFTSIVNQPTDIISVGKLSSVYTDYLNYVCKILGYSTGFSSIFKEGTFHDTFDSNTFIELLNQQKLNGTIEINNVTLLFEYLCNVVDIFGNRKLYETPISSGFFPGDIIYIPHGFKFKMTLSLDSMLPSQSTDLSGNFYNTFYDNDLSGNMTIDLIHKRHIEYCVYIPLVIILTN